jgi:hypothetical protein
LQCCQGATRHTRYKVDFEELSSNLQLLTAEGECLLDPSNSNANMGMVDKMNDAGRG